MKKQLLIAAVAATMTSVAIADISITGATKVNYTNKDMTASSTAAVGTAPVSYTAAVAAHVSPTTGAWVDFAAQSGTAGIGYTAATSTAANSTNTFNHDVDFTIVGKTGGTAVSATFQTSAKATLVTENVFLTTSIGDVNIKTGSYSGADSNMANGERADGKFSADTTIGGIKIQYEDTDAAGNNSSVTMSGAMSGITLSHEIFDASTDTTVSGSMGGVNVKYRSVDADAANSDKTSLVVSGEMNGVTATYVNVDVDGTGKTTSDDFFDTHDTADINEATGYSLATSVAGNKVTFKSYDIKSSSTANDDSYSKVIVTRPLASGATFELTYVDADMDVATVADYTSLDLELAVKF